MWSCDLGPSNSLISATLTFPTWAIRRCRWWASPKAPPGLKVWCLCEVPVHCGTGGCKKRCPWWYLCRIDLDIIRITDQERPSLLKVTPSWEVHTSCWCNRRKPGYARRWLPHFCWEMPKLCVPWIIWHRCRCGLRSLAAIAAYWSGFYLKIPKSYVWGFWLVIQPSRAESKASDLGQFFLEQVS